MRRRRASEGADGGGNGAGTGKPPPAKRTTLLAFAGFRSSTVRVTSRTSTTASGSEGSSAPLQPPPPPPLPLPQWGRLIDEGAVKIAQLRRLLLLTGPAPPPGIPALRRNFTAAYSSPFSDAFNRTPGQGAAGSYGWGSGVRSALNRGCLGVGGAEAGSGEAMLVIEPGGESEEGDEEDEEPSGVSRGDSSGSGMSGRETGSSHHRRNFTLIATWALERSGGLVDDPGDVAVLRGILDGTSPSALELFLRMYHSPRPLYRVNTKPGEEGGDVEAAVEELVGKGLVHDVMGMGQHQGEGVVLMHTYEIVNVLRADELARLNNSILGPAGARGNSGSGGGGGSGGWSRTRDDSLGALETFIEQCMASPYPQQHALLRRRLGKDLLKFLGTCSAGSSSSSSSRFLLVAPAVGKLLHRVYALFFLASGYEADDAVILLRQNLGGALRFVDMTGPQQQQQQQDGEAANGASTAAMPPTPITRITGPFRPLFNHMLALVDTFEDAVLKGDGPVAYACLHQAADLFLPPPAAAASTAGRAAAELGGEPRWEPAIVVVDDDDDHDDDVIVIEPNPTAAAPSLLSIGGAGAAGSAAGASFSSSSSSLAAPVAMPHRSSPPFPPGYQGLEHLPKPLVRMAVKIVGRGINLLERERKHAEALHYLGILLDGPLRSPWLAACRGHFHARRVVDLGHVNRPEAQIKACEVALAEAGVDGEDRLFLQQKLVALAVPPRRWKKPSFPALRAAPVLQLRLGDLGRRNGGGKSLEDRVLDYLLGEEMVTGGGGGGGGGQWEGAHCENGVWLTLFGALCHDVLFAPVAAADDKDGAPFLTPYQNAPHDLTLGRGAFLARPGRRAALDRCLERIGRGETGAMLAEVFGCPRRRGAMCIGVDWHAYSLESLQRIADGMGPAALRLLCETLASDYTLWSHGLPDLLLWRVDGVAGVRLVEVKGPGDSLSHSQTCWIDKLLGAGVRVEVARVAEAGAD